MFTLIVPSNLACIKLIKQIDIKLADFISLNIKNLKNNNIIFKNFSFKCYSYLQTNTIRSCIKDLSFNALFSIEVKIDLLSCEYFELISEGFKFKPSIETRFNSVSLLI